MAGAWSLGRLRWLAPVSLVAALALGLGGVPTGDSASRDPACRSDPSAGVHDAGRLNIQSSCAVVTGTIVSRNDSRSQETDGDWSFDISVDQGLRSTFGSTIHAEIVPQDSITPPPLGGHVRLVGPFVIDTQAATGNLNEIHPVWSATSADCTSGCQTTTVPGQPAGVSATPGDAGVQVGWRAPSNNGGAQITSYVVAYAPAGADGKRQAISSGSGTSATIGGLANGTSYTFTVSAVNSVGQGPASSPASAQPFTVPGSPSAVSATSGNASAQVSWAPPGSDGGKPITGYTVTAAPGRATASVNGSTTQAAVTGLSNGTSYTFSVQAANAAGSGPAASSSPVVPTAPAPPPATPPGSSPTPGSPQNPPAPGAGQGYWMVSSGGAVFPFGDARPSGSTASIHLNRPVVGMAPSPSGNGYWMVATDGGIFNFGDARFLGSAGSIRLNKPIVGMASTPSGSGYWLVASDGGIFSYGDAPFLGSTGSIRLNQPIVGMASTPLGNGYWLVASDGGIFSYGDARFFGSTGSIRLNKPIVGMASTPSGSGYWMVATDGGIFNFGNAPFVGSAGSVVGAPVVGMASTPSGGGYWLATSDGQTYTFGDAVVKGSAAPGIAAIGRLH